jgi:hypothetical protein
MRCKLELILLDVHVLVDIYISECDSDIVWLNLSTVVTVKEVVQLR